MPSVSTADPDSLAAQFFQLIRQPTLDQSLLQSTREQLKVLCPVVEQFSFEVVDAAEAVEAAGDEGKKEITAVEAGTPSSTLSVWNSVKLVSLIEICDADCCGAAIGATKVSALDFKACILPLEGEEACSYATHRLKSVPRIRFSEGWFDLAIPVPMSTVGKAVQAFSRPLLTRDDLYYMGPGSLGFNRLLDIKMEPRVWKVLLEHFPGREALRDPHQQAPQPAAEAQAAKNLSADLKREVTDNPIFSPSRGGKSAGYFGEAVDATEGNGIPFSSQRSVSSSHKWSDVSSSRRGSQPYDNRSGVGKPKDPEETGSVFSSSIKQRLKCNSPQPERRRGGL
jgi:hypothetical protein